MLKTQKCYTQTIYIWRSDHIRLVKHTDDISLSVAVVAKDKPDEHVDILTVRIFTGAGEVPINS